MIGRRATISLASLCTLLFCAIVAQSASAVPATNTTTFTCVKVESGAGFSDEHCEKEVASGAKFKHELIPLNTTTELDANNQKATEETKSSEPIVLKSKVIGVKVTIECAVMKTASNKSFVHNVETVEKKHTFTGNGTAEFSECNVKELPNCIVKEPITADANFEGVEGLDGPKEAEKGKAMGVRFTGANGEETFGSIEFKNKGAEKCGANGKSFAVKGSAIGTSGPTTESSQINKSSGATIVFTPQFKMQEMKLGSESAEVSMIATPKGAGGGPPISITTVT
jgi:hypothetical protein